MTPSTELPTHSAAGRPMPLAARSLALAMTLLLALSAGCASSGVIDARALPPQYALAHVENSRTIDLSRLATFAVSNQRIDRGDVLDVTLGTGYADSVNNTTPVRVGDDGMANVPLVGKVFVSGFELEGAEQAIAAAGVSRGVFRDPHVTVTMHAQRINRVTVIGAVEKAGVYELPRGSSSLLAAIVAAGGMSKDAGTEVELRHPARAAVGPSAAANWNSVAQRPEQLAGFQGPQAPPPGTPRPQGFQPASSVRVNLVTAAAEGSNGYFLDDGDVVMVSKRDPQPVQVIGLVTKPGQYDLPVSQDLRVLDALAMAGGWSSPVADKVHVIRNMPGRPEPVVIEISIDEAKMHGKGNLLLGPGDTVSVEQTPATEFYDAFTRFLHFGLDGSVPLF